MASINRVFLIGNVGKDPEIREIEGGKIATITLATSESFTDRSGQRKEQTEWHTIVVFGKLADIVDKYIRKSSMLFVDGKIRTRSWQDRDNTMHFKTEIVANQIQMLNKPGDKPQPQEQRDEDLPDFF